MASLNEILARAETLAAGRGADASQSPVIDAGMTAEALFPHAVRFAMAKLLNSGANLHEMTAEHTISITSGVGALPATVLKEAVKFATFPTRKYCTVVSFGDFQRDTFPMLDYVAVNNSQVLFKPSSYSLPTGDNPFTGNLVANFVTIPAKPATATADTGLSAKVVDEVVLTIAGALTGEIKLEILMETELV